MTPSPETGRQPSSTLANLVLLQDLDLMIRDAKDPEQAEDLGRMGFKVEGLEKLQAAREELAGRLDRRVLGLYKTAAGRYAGRAVVPVQNKVCLGCWAVQPTGFDVQSERVATCQSCGRILYPL